MLLIEITYIIKSRKTHLLRFYKLNFNIRLTCDYCKMVMVTMLVYCPRIHLFLAQSHLPVLAVMRGKFELKSCC